MRLLTIKSEEDCREALIEIEKLFDAKPDTPKNPMIML